MVHWLWRAGGRRGGGGWWENNVPERKKGVKGACAKGCTGHGTFDLKTLQSFFLSIFGFEFRKLAKLAKVGKKTKLRRFITRVL